MTDDIEARVDELAVREAQAGGPEALVQSLADGLKRQGRYIAITAISVAADIILSVVLALVVLITHNTTDRANSNAAAIRQVVHTQALDAWTQCEKSAVNTTKINSTDLAFVQFLQSLPTTNSTPEGKAALATFEEIYQDAVLAVPVCGDQPK